MSTKRKRGTTASASTQPSREWGHWTNGDHDKAFVIRDDINAIDAYDAATMRLEQAELLLREREPTGTDEHPTLDPVIVATLALLSQARVAYRAAFHRADRP